MTRNTDPTRTTRETVFRRDERRCVVCGCEAYWRGLQVHHRRPRAMGGSRRPDTNSPPNLLTVCLDHHAWIESHRMESLAAGLLLRQSDDPAQVPVDTWRGRIYLTPDGSFHAVTV
jgi:5-methylcytosine-specific restriction protein A